MSYDITLNDPVSGETLQVPGHLMTGGMFKAELNSAGQLVPSLNTEAWLNITYNYSSYYYEATDGNPDFYVDGENAGIRGLYGKTGLESISMLGTMIKRIRDKYPDLETDSDYWKSCPGNAVKPLYQLLAFARMRPDGVWDGD